MAEYGKKKQEGGDGIKRWERILALPESQEVYDMVTGQKYRVGQFVPLHNDAFQGRVEYFKIKGTSEQVYVPHLRLIGDKVRCSLMGGE